MENYKIEYKLFNEKYNELFNKYFMTGGADTLIDTEIQIKIQKINELQEKYNEKLEIYNEQLTNFQTFTDLRANLNLNIEIVSNLNYTYNTGEEKESINNRINTNNKELFKKINDLKLNFKILDKNYEILNDKFENYKKNTNEFKITIKNIDSYVQDGGFFTPRQPEPANIEDNNDNKNNNVLSNQVNSDDNQENIEDYQKIILNLSDDKSINSKKENIKTIIKQIRNIFLDLKFIDGDEN